MDIVLSHLIILKVRVRMKILDLENIVFASVHDHWLKIFNSCKECNFLYARNFMRFTHDTRIQETLNHWFSKWA